MLTKALFVLIILSITLPALAEDKNPAQYSADILTSKLNNHIIKGVCYNPVPVGLGYDYDLSKDDTKPWLLDGKLMQEMGVNTVYLYRPGNNLSNTKLIIDDFYKIFGIKTIICHDLGLWRYPAINYASPGDRNALEQEVLAMVNALKDCEGVLFWALGAENNYSFPDRAAKNVGKEDFDAKIKTIAMEYYEFVNQLAGCIKTVDSAHPVAMGNAELRFLEYAKEYLNNIDILACVSYRGKSFGSFWQDLAKITDKPVALVEFGCDRYDVLRNKEDEDIQAAFINSQWQEIERYIEKSVCLGGCVFEWADEWWKHKQGDKAGWSVHDTEGSWQGGGYYFDIAVGNHQNMNEEWWGIVAISPEEENGINKRIPKKAYYTLQGLWKNQRKVAQCEKED